LHQAAILGDTDDIIKNLLKFNANVNILNENNQSPLHLACGKNRVENVRLLINVNGIDLNGKDKYGFTPLLKAIASLSFESALLLLNLCSNDLDINAADNLGNTALHYSMEENHKEISCLLIDCGADYLVKNSEGKFCIDMVNNDNFKLEMLEFVKQYKGTEK